MKKISGIFEKKDKPALVEVKAGESGLAFLTVKRDLLRESYQLTALNAMGEKTVLMSGPDIDAAYSMFAGLVDANENLTSLYPLADCALDLDRVEAFSRQEQLCLARLKGGERSPVVFFSMDEAQVDEVTQDLGTMLEAHRHKSRAFSNAPPPRPQNQTPSASILEFPVK